MLNFNDAHIRKRQKMLTTMPDMSLYSNNDSSDENFYALLSPLRTPMVRISDENHADDQSTFGSFFLTPNPTPERQIDHENCNVEKRMKSNKSGSPSSTCGYVQQNFSVQTTADGTLGSLNQGLLMPTNTNVNMSFRPFFQSPSTTTMVQTTMSENIGSWSQIPHPMTNNSNQNSSYHQPTQGSQFPLQNSMHGNMAPLNPPYSISSSYQPSSIFHQRSSNAMGPAPFSSSMHPFDQISTPVNMDPWHPSSVMSSSSNFNYHQSTLPYPSSNYGNSVVYTPTLSPSTPLCHAQNTHEPAPRLLNVSNSIPSKESRSRKRKIVEDSIEVSEREESEKQEKPKETCKVCIDAPASGTNYGIPTCSSCRGFFHRMMKDFMLEGFEIPRCNSKSCEVKAYDEMGEGVSNCTYCRLKRCFKVGMKPERIRRPKPGEMHLRDKNRMRLLVERFKDSIEMERNSAPITTIAKSSKTMDSINTLMMVEARSKKLFDSDFKPNPQYLGCLTNILQLPSLLENEIMNKKPSNWPLPQDYFDKLIIRIQANMNMGINDPSVLGEYRCWITIQFVLAVEFAKALSFFKELELDDQVTQLRHAIIPLVIINQAYYSYNNKAEVVTMPDGLNPYYYYTVIETLKETFMNAESDNYGFPERIEKLFKECKAHYGHKNLYVLLNNWCRSFLPLTIEKGGAEAISMNSIKLLKDLLVSEKEYILIKAIILCRPSDKLSNDAKRRLVDQKHKYSDELKRMLVDGFGETEGIRRFEELIALVKSYYVMADLVKPNFTGNSILALNQFTTKALNDLIDDVINN